jgi:hypothetical protein
MFRYFLISSLGLILMSFMGCAATKEVTVPVQESKFEERKEDRGAKQDSKASQPDEISVLEERWGVKVLGIRLTAYDHMLDFRFRIIDPEKASVLLSKQTQVYAIDQATGSKLSVPRTRLGPMRQTGVKPPANRDYIFLFGNSGKVVKQGSYVTVVIGDLKLENLIVKGEME